MSVWPEGKTFAFTVFDDTDNMTLEKGPRVYDLLADLGFRTSKSVWPIRGRAAPTIGGATCADPDYRKWAQTLQERGFEIALHGVSYATATRDEICRGMDAFHGYFGHFPDSHANHADSLDSIYWGKARLSPPARQAYAALHRFSLPEWQGHVVGSPHFWGDICRERVRYVRNFVFGDVNTLRACPMMPYHDADRPFVNAWFASSEGPDVQSYVQMLSEANQDRLEAEGGACIMYTHFASGFVEDGGVHPRFAQLMTRLSRKPGWFVPVRTLLDHLAGLPSGGGVITPRQRRRLELSWLRHKIRVRGTT